MYSLTGTSPITYYNLSPGDHTASVKAQAIKLGQPLEVAVAKRNFTIVPPGNSIYNRMSCRSHCIFLKELLLNHKRFHLVK